MGFSLEGGVTRHQSRGRLRLIGRVVVAAQQGWLLAVEKLIRRLDQLHHQLPRCLLTLPILVLVRRNCSTPIIVKSHIRCSTKAPKKQIQSSLSGRPEHRMRVDVGVSDLLPEAVARIEDQP